MIFPSGECPEGTYCPAGTADPIGCEAGTYNDLPRQASCRPCVPGFYCPANSTTYLNTPCPKGAYCPLGTESAYQYECPAGTFNNATMGDDPYDCIPCTRKYVSRVDRLVNFSTDQQNEIALGKICSYLNSAGKFCGSDGLSEPTGDCAPGYYCLGGAYTDQPVLYPPGSERFTLNETLCPVYSVNETGDLCPPGYLLSSWKLNCFY